MAYKLSVNRRGPEFIQGMFTEALRQRNQKPGSTNSVGATDANGNDGDVGPRALLCIYIYIYIHLSQRPMLIISLQEFPSDSISAQPPVSHRPLSTSPPPFVLSAFSYPRPFFLFCTSECSNHTSIPSVSTRAFFVAAVFLFYFFYLLDAMHLIIRRVLPALKSLYKWNKCDLRGRVGLFTLFLTHPYSDLIRLISLIKFK